MEEYLAHFSAGLSQDIQQYATNDVFRHSRYIFTHRRGKQQYGWCTHCSREFKTSGLGHNTKDVCPECQSLCTVKASGLGRKTMVDGAYFVYYEKSVRDPKVIVARGIYAVRDYSEDYHNVKTLYLERSRYVFQMGSSLMLERYGYYSMAKTMEHGEYNRRKSVYSLSGQYDVHQNTVTYYSRESIKEAVRDTPFSWSGWESYNSDEMVKFFDLYSRYPCVEYLTKFGFGDLVEAKLTGGNTYSAINWRGKTLFKVLRLTKKELNEVKTSGKSVDPLFLRLLQISRKEHSDLSIAELSAIQKGYGYYFQELQKFLKYATLKKINVFINKQFKDKNTYTNDLNKKSKHYGNYHQVLITWKDYIADCITLEMDLKEDQVLFPRDLYTAHQNTIKQIKVKEDETLRKGIRARVKLLEKYRFEDSGLLIRPAQDAKELIEEGKALCHCVGTYAKNYASGKTNIFFVRKIDEPEKPYYTVEVINNQIRQCRGKNNCSPDDDVKAFIRAFTEQKLNSKKEKTRTRIAIPA